MSETLFVTGAAGHLGRAVVQHLLDDERVEADRIVAGSRDPAQLADLADRGVRTVRVDFDEAQGLAAAFSGADRLLLVSTDALGVPGRRLSQHKTAIAAAKAAGVGHVLYTSMPDPAASLITFAPDHLGTEEALKASGLGWTILRNGWYLENLATLLAQSLAIGQIVTSAGAGRYSPLARDDCARAAAAALATGKVDWRTVTLTGPELLSIRDIAVSASTVFGKQLTVVDLTDAELEAGMVKHGIPPFVAPMLVSMDANIREHKFDILTDEVEALIGRPPQELENWLVLHKAELMAATDKP